MYRLHKIIGFIFLGIFSIVIFNYVFFSALINFKKSDFRKELFKTTVVLSKVELISIPKEDVFKNKNGIEWHEKGKEISINGKFYEVVKIEEKGNKKIIYALLDENENKLVNSFFANNIKHNYLLNDFLQKSSFIMDNDGCFNFEFKQPFSSSSSYNNYTGNTTLPDFYSKIIKPPRLA